MNIRLMTTIFLSVALFAFRFIPSPDNFTPVLALCLVAGWVSRGQWYGMVLPILAMMAADSQLGFYPGWAFTYIPLVAIVVMGCWLKTKASSVAGYSLASSIVFFLVSNFGVWFSTALYSKDVTGLIDCYIAGIPFLREMSGIPFFGNTFVSTFVFSSVLVSVLSWALNFNEKSQAVEQ